MFRPEGFDDGVGELVVDRWLEPEGGPSVLERQVSDHILDRLKYQNLSFPEVDVRESDGRPPVAEGLPALPAPTETRTHAQLYARQVREAADAYAERVRREVEHARTLAFEEIGEFRRQTELHAELIRQESERELQLRRRALEQMMTRMGESVAEDLRKRETNARVAEQAALESLTEAARDISNALERFIGDDHFGTGSAIDLIDRRLKEHHL